MMLHDDILSLLGVHTRESEQEQAREAERAGVTGSAGILDLRV